jgi:FkbM family methyltransferase
MISYAQNFEDVILARAFKGRTDGFYVDVGANDPVDNSVTKHFYELGWHGVNIDPVIACHRALTKDRPRDVNLCVAVGSTRSTLTLFDFDASGVSTFDPDSANYFRSRGMKSSERPVEVVPLRDLCERYCPGPIDFMKIDVEGWELPVLEGGDWQRFRPRVLLVEATKPNSNDPNWERWEPFVLKQGYVFAYFDGLNRFYVAEEEQQLLPHFKFPPNVMDDFETYRIVQLREELTHYRRALTMRGILPYILGKLTRKASSLVRSERRSKST